MSDYSVTFDSDELAAVLVAVISYRENYEDDWGQLGFWQLSFWPEEQKEYEAYIRAEDKLRTAGKE